MISHSMIDTPCVHMDYGCVYMLINCDVSSLGLEWYEDLECRDI